MLLLTTLLCCSGLQASDIPLSKEELQQHQRFATWSGIEPDKWATLWLIKRYVAPDAYFSLVEPNTEMPADALAFGVPEVAIRRGNQQSMFRKLKNALALDGQELDYLDGIIHDVEVNIWDAPAHKHSAWFETLYRTLQARYQRTEAVSYTHLTLPTICSV